jgi:hypothetical protein
MSINMVTGTTGTCNSNRDHSRLAPVDEVIERAEWWLINDCPDAGADAFASAVDLRDSYHLSSSLAEAQLNDIWNRVACEPPLTPSQIAEAVRQAYCFRPAIIGAQANRPTPSQPGASGVVETAEQARASEPDSAPPAQSAGAHAASASAQPGAQAAPVSPSAVVATPSVDTTECALCASRRKAKRERTRRWRALRVRPATKREVANVQ